MILYEFSNLNHLNRSSNAKVMDFTNLNPKSVFKFNFSIYFPEGNPDLMRKHGVSVRDVSLTAGPHRAVTARH